MTLFGTPEEHAANPPESWLVTLRARGAWDLHVVAGGRLDTFPTRRQAEEAKRSGWLVSLYEKETRWYAGEQVDGWHLYAPAVAVAKRCAKCSGPLPSPVLGDDPQERCPLCGDEPPSGADLVELLREAMTPLIRFRDRGLDVENIVEGDELRAAAEDLDRAFDYLDAALSGLDETDEGVEGACRFCDDDGPHEGFCCEDCFNILGDEDAWDLQIEAQREMVSRAAGPEMGLLPVLRGPDAAAFVRSAGLDDLAALFVVDEAPHGS